MQAVAPGADPLQNIGSIPEPTKPAKSKGTAKSGGANSTAASEGKGGRKRNRAKHAAQVAELNAFLDDAAAPEPADDSGDTKRRVCTIHAGKDESAR